MYTTLHDNHVSFNVITVHNFEFCYKQHTIWESTKFITCIVYVLLLFIVIKRYACRLKYFLLHSELHALSAVWLCP